jgi:hypothetical protein
MNKPIFLLMTDMIAKKNNYLQQGRGGKHEVPTVPLLRHQLREFALRPHVHLCLLSAQGKQVQRLPEGKICLHRGFFVNNYELQSASLKINLISEPNRLNIAGNSFVRHVYDPVTDILISTLSMKSFLMKYKDDLRYTSYYFVLSF